MDQGTVVSPSTDSFGQPHSWITLQTAILLWVLLAVQFAATALTPFGLADLDASSKMFLLIGISFSQPALLAVWTVFGPQRAAVRLPLSLWISAAGGLSLMGGVSANAGFNDAEVLLLGAAWSLAFFVFQPALWLIRAVRRWRLERPPTIAANVSRREQKLTRQFSLRALLGWIFAAALLLGAFRAFAPDISMDREATFDLLPEAGFIGISIALAGLPVVALAWIILAEGRRLTLRIILCLLIVLGLAAGCNAFGFLNDLLDPEATLLVEAGALFNGFIAFGVLRGCGYRLQRNSRNCAESAVQIPLTRATMSHRRFAFALAPVVAMAASLASFVPGRLEQWRQAEIRADWRRSDLEVAFADDGAVERLRCNQRAAITDDICRRIAGLGKLRALDLTGSTLSDRQLILLSSLSNLEELNLSSTAITDEGVKQLRKFPRLASLTLMNTSISNRGLSHLQESPGLRELKLCLTDVSDDGLPALAQLHNLKTVDLRLTAVTAAGVEKIANSRPRTKIEFGACDALVKRLPTIELFHRGTLGVGVSFTRMKLKRLHARGKTAVNGVMVAVTDGALNFLASHTELEELDLRESAVSDKGIMTLGKLKNLKRLDLRGAAVTESGAAKLARVLPDCEILR